jgi:hypothetical protein
MDDTNELTLYQTQKYLKNQEDIIHYLHCSGVSDLSDTFLI